MQEASEAVKSGHNAMDLSTEHILDWLQEPDGRRLEELWRQADDIRRAAVGEAVHLRGIIEFSSYCDRRCLYCGLRGPNRNVRRYRMSEREVVDAAVRARKLGYGTVVLQSGEEANLDLHWMERVIRGIKRATRMAVTLSLGERSDGELEAFRSAGADRYLLRFETSNRELYELIHPAAARGNGERDRMAILGVLRELGYEVGSGVMVGIPGQTFADLARDIETFRELDLDMIGLGPYVADPSTPLGRVPQRFVAPAGEQVPADALFALKMVALARVACPMTNIPATTALRTVNAKDGLELALQRGANVIMPDVTPVPYRDAYAIYPGKAEVNDDPLLDRDRVTERITALGRTVGHGRGDSPNILKRRRPRRLVS